VTCGLGDCLARLESLIIMDSTAVADVSLDVVVLVLLLCKKNYFSIGCLEHNIGLLPWMYPSKGD